jgi:protein N-lysine methyltransferase METTL21D
MKGKYISDREIEACGRELIIKQNLENDIEHGGSVWDAAIVLAKYFETFPKDYFLNKKILELGSGNGYLGIVLSILGANVIMTDRKNLLPLIEENVKINQMENLIGKSIFIKECEWGITKLNEDYDIIIASDCIYDKESMWKEFAQALIDLSTKDTLIILSYENRSEVDAAFFPFIETQHFSVKKIDSEELDPFWKCEDIGIYHLNKNL